MSRDDSPRLADLDENSLSPEQRVVFDEIRSGPRGGVEGPLRVWLRSPKLATHAQALGAFCRYGTRLPPRLSELAILVTGAFWKAGFEWAVHAPIAMKAGLSEEVTEAIHAGALPRFEAEDEAAVHAFSLELQRDRRVSDETYRRCVAAIGLEGTVELVGILGYYTLISMTINAFEVPLPDGADEPFPER
ncbi:carboxymuconolactone decarboxylase family protein [Pseudochelatococcus sp. B33]